MRSAKVRGGDCPAGGRRRCPPRFLHRSASALRHRPGATARRRTGVEPAAVAGERRPRQAASSPEVAGYLNLLGRRPVARRAGPRRHACPRQARSGSTIVRHQARWRRADGVARGPPATARSGVAQFARGRFAPRSGKTFAAPHHIASFWSRPWMRGRGGGWYRCCRRRTRPEPRIGVHRGDRLAIACKVEGCLEVLGHRSDVLALGGSRCGSR